MQYLLTQEEYNELFSEKKRRTDQYQDNLQQFCTLAAMHRPIYRIENGTTRPWGCILGPSKQTPVYCDECPSRRICPYKHKEFSQ